MSQKATTDIDRAVGLRMTALRKAKGLSQTAVGTALGVTFQQVQKYEKGQNRVGAGRLRKFAALLEVPISTLFDEGHEAGGNETFALLAENGAVELIRAYAAIEDDQMRRDVLALVRIAARIGAGPVAGSA